MSSAIDLSQVPAPDVIEAIDFESIMEDMKVDLLSRDASLDAVELESEPVTKLLEVCAYREMLLRQRVNEAARAVMLAYSMAADLDNLGALFNVERKLLEAGDSDAVPPVPPTYETDSEFRRRIQLSFEGLSTAGPSGAYIFHALGADPDVRDASVTSPNPGEIKVSVLSRQGDGTADAALLSAVDAALSADDVRPLTDQVFVVSAEITPYTVDATLTLYPGPDSSLVNASAEVSLANYIEQNHKLGRDITLSGLYAALHQNGVQKVTLASPPADIVIAPHESAFCTGATVAVGGTDE